MVRIVATVLFVILVASASVAAPSADDAKQAATSTSTITVSDPANPTDSNKNGDSLKTTDPPSDAASKATKTDTTSLDKKTKTTKTTAPVVDTTTVGDIQPGDAAKSARPKPKKKKTSSTGGDSTPPTLSTTAATASDPRNPDGIKNDGKSSGVTSTSGGAKKTDGALETPNGSAVKKDDSGAGGSTFGYVAGLVSSGLSYVKDTVTSSLKAVKGALFKGNTPSAPTTPKITGGTVLMNFLDMCPTAGGQPIYNPVSYTALDCTKDGDCQQTNAVGDKDETAKCEKAKSKKKGHEENSEGICCSVKATCLGNWDYLKATTDWPTICPECGGKKQSPIDIPVSATGTPALTLVPEGSKIAFVNYNVTLDVQMFNNGHTAQISYDSSVSEDGRPYIKLTPDKSKLARKGDYELIQIHMHWSEDNSLGSEHTVGNVSYPIEIHLVHKMKQKSDKDKLALAVLGVFAQVKCDVDRKSPPDDVFDMSDDVFNAANAPHDEDPRPRPPLKLSLNSLLPQDRDSFFYYSGSLTTPPCSEVVEWTIFKDPIQIPDYMLAELRKMPSHGHGPLKTNNRAPQALGSRKVFFRGDKPPEAGPAATPKQCAGAKDASSSADKTSDLAVAAAKDKYTTKSNTGSDSDNRAPMIITGSTSKSKSKPPTPTRSTSKTANGGGDGGSDGGGNISR